MRDYWAPMAFYFYLAIGVAAVIAFAMKIRAARSTDRFGLEGIQDTIFRITFSANSWLGKLRIMMIWGLKGLSVLTGWPGAMVFGNSPSRKKLQNVSVYTVAAAGNVDALPDIYSSIAIFIIGVLTYMFYNMFSPPFYYLLAFLWLLVIHTISRHASYLPGLLSLPTQLRQSSGNPYLVFFILLIMDYGSLVLIFNGLLTWPKGVTPTISDIYEMHLDIFTFRKVKEYFFYGEQITTLQIAMCLGGAFYYDTLAQLVFKRKEFVRTDEDYILIANKYAVLGQFNRALDYLRKVKDIGGKASRVKAAALFGVNQLPAALETLTFAVRSEREGFSRGAVFTDMIECVLLAPIAKECIFSFLKEATAPPIEDLRLQNLLILAVTRFHFRPEELSDLFVDEKTKSIVPLSHARVLLMNGHITEALDVLNSRLPAKESEEIARKVTLLDIALYNHDTSREDVTAEFERWVAGNLKSISQLCSAQMEDWERVEVLSLIFFVELLAKRFNSPRLQEIIFLRNTVKRGIGDNERNRKTISIVEQRARFQHRSEGLIFEE